MLLIEDDPTIRQAYTLTLRRRGYQVVTEATGAAGVATARRARPDVVLLDAMLPDVDGFDVCRLIRAESSVPVLMLTARDSDSDVVGGLESGADDYLVKPVAAPVLDARIRAVLRRDARRTCEPAVLSARGVVIDVDSLAVTLDGVPVELAPAEIRLLIVLVRNPGRVLSRERLRTEAWPDGASAGARAVDTAVQRLRAKIESDPADPVLVRTVRGFGYRFG
ncbi:two-component system response regulator [Mycetocola reblochoni REB411]|uniref:Two-component system response regulator n=1 Tax=Mycetocola reblochoni REB411 TaxID=1255698 RepID=A0A1R4KCE3_9MICO|nr:two-component system response regulator [Mycetocola reblochoni REB411]